MKYFMKLTVLVVAVFAYSSSFSSPVGFYSGQVGDGSIGGFQFRKTDSAMYVAATKMGLPEKITKRSHVWAIYCNHKKEAQCHIFGYASGIGYAVYHDDNNLLGVYGSDQKSPAMIQLDVEKVIDATKFMKGVAAKEIVKKLLSSKIVFIRTRYSSEYSLPKDGKGTNLGFKQAYSYVKWFMNNKRHVEKNPVSRKSSPLHAHGNRNHSHPLPASGLNHRHN